MALKFNHVTDTIDSTGGTITIVGFDPNIPDATTSDSGLMSAADKTKLDGIESGAEVNDVDSVFGRTGAVEATSGDYSADQIDFTPAGTLVSTDVQAALEELDTNIGTLDSEKADLASPEFTGTPTAPTATADTNTTQIATTAFVVGQGYVKSADLGDYAELSGADFTGPVSAPSYSQLDGSFSVLGDAKVSLLVLRAVTTDATQTELLLNDNSRMALANDSTWFFEVQVVARRTDVDGESAAFTYKGAIDRNTNAASTALVGTVAEEIVARDDVDWVVTVDADTTNGSLRIRVTGEAAKNIRWVASVKTIEVIG